MLSDKQLEDICLAYEPSVRRCRYLEQDDEDMHKFYCLKKMPDRKDEIDIDLNQFINECQKKGKDSSKENVPLGDNCSGYIKLKYKEQGYDV